MRLFSEMAKPWFAWLLVPLLTPFLLGGVAAGDEAWVLRMVHGFLASPLSFADYARSGEGWYTAHHFLWFWLLYLTVQLGQLAHLGPMLTEVVISAQTVAAGLSAIVLCYIFLTQRVNLPPPLSLWTVMGFFVAGYGVFTFTMGGVVESYLALAMAARLFFSEREMRACDAITLGLIDAVMTGLKGYSLVFVIMTWPLLRGPWRTRASYGGTLCALLLLLGASKIWLWNPYYAHALENTGNPPIIHNFFAQIFSPWTGLLTCLPILCTLLWQTPSRRKHLLLKSLGLLALIAIFSLYVFFNGDIAGGRYIFPFLICLMPEIALASANMLKQFPKTAWLLPIAVFAFLPVAGVRTPFFTNQSTVTRVGTCTPDHPVVRAWKTIIADASGVEKIAICYNYKAYVVETHDAASPRLAPWRIAYLLRGGFSSDFRSQAHDAVQKTHDAWGDGIATKLRHMGLGAPQLWMFLGLLPAGLVLVLSILAAACLARNRASWLTDTVAKPR